MHRSELSELENQRGIKFSDPFEAVSLFEQTVARFAGARYGVAVDSCSHGIELSLRFLEAKGQLGIPKHTYLSVPMTALKLNLKIHWITDLWEGTYALGPYPVIDSSLRFKEGMYQASTFYCLSFQNKKRIPIGRGGMILVDEPEAYQWLQRAAYDGRTRGVPWKDQKIQQLGYHYYMTPEDAARGILLFDRLQDQSDLGGAGDYPDLSGYEIFSRD